MRSDAHYALNANDDLFAYGDNGNAHPYGLPNALPKYAALTWFGYKSWMDGPKSSRPNPYSKYQPARWTNATAKTQGASGLSVATVLICDRVEISSWRRSIIDCCSHKKGVIGGPNALFGDIYAEWVRVSQIGWP
jgi:hypothetical protein